MTRVHPSSYALRSPFPPPQIPGNPSHFFLLQIPGRSLPKSSLPRCFTLFTMGEEHPSPDVGSLLGSLSTMKETDPYPLAFEIYLFFGEKLPLLFLSLVAGPCIGPPPSGSPLLWCSETVSPSSRFSLARALLRGPSTSGIFAAKRFSFFFISYVPGAAHGFFSDSYLVA